MKIQQVFLISFPLCQAAAFVYVFKNLSLRSVYFNVMAPKSSSASRVQSPLNDDSFDILSGPPWQVFPSHQLERLRDIHGHRNVKLVHIVRHAEGTHNVNMEYKSSINLDARLTGKGYGQCQALADRISQDESLHSLLQAEDTFVLTSPLTRCVQTALRSFPHLVPHVPVVAQEAWRETVNYNCDRRRHLDEIRQEFPQVDFGECADAHDAIWHDYRRRLGDHWDSHMESAELYRVAQRGVEGLKLLEERPESQLIVCTHSAFLRCILNWGQTGGVPKLMPQRLDDRDDKSSSVLFRYAEDVVKRNDGTEMAFERYMRRDFANCELRSFCLLVRSTSR